MQQAVQKPQTIMIREFVVADFKDNEVHPVERLQMPDPQEVTFMGLRLSSPDFSTVQIVVSVGCADTTGTVVRRVEAMQPNLPAAIIPRTYIGSLQVHDQPYHFFLSVPPPEPLQFSVTTTVVSSR